MTAAFRYLILRAGQPLEIEEARQCVLLLLLALNPTFDQDVPEFGIRTLWAPRANIARFNFIRHFRKHGLNRAVLLEDAMDFVEQRLVPPGESWRRLKTLAEAVCRRLGVAVRLPAARADEPQLTPLQFHIVRLISQAAGPIPGVHIENLVRPHGASSWVRAALGELHLRMRVLHNDDQAYSLITASGR